MTRADKSRNPLCLIPARAGSKRLPKKNMALLRGKPLVAWTIECALGSGLFDQVYVSSESPEILSEAAERGACALERPAKLAGDHVTLKELCLHEIPELSRARGYTDLYLLLPSSPLRRPATLVKAWKAYVESNAGTLLSVVKSPHPPQWAMTFENDRLVPLYPQEYQKIRQDLKEALYHDGGHLITRIKTFVSRRDLISKDTVAFVSPPEESVDINEPLDLQWADFLLTRQGGDL